MTTSDLAEGLRGIIKHHGGSAYPAVHLFGIKFADELKGHSLKDICALANISANYATEITKGRKMAPFVDLKK